jgi:hypothetical protein
LLLVSFVKLHGRMPGVYSKATPRTTTGKEFKYYLFRFSSLTIADVRPSFRNSAIGFCGLYFIAGCMNRGAIRARYGISNFHDDRCGRALPIINRWL